MVGTNKRDSALTVEWVVRDLTDALPKRPSGESTEPFLNALGVTPVSFDDWKAIDQVEIQNGEAVGRPRVKCLTEAAQKEAIKNARRESVPNRIR